MAKTIIILDFYEVRTAIKEYIQRWHQKKLYPDGIIGDDNMKFLIKEKDVKFDYETMLTKSYLDSVEVICQ